MVIGECGARVEKLLIGLVDFLYNITENVFLIFSLLKPCVNVYKTEATDVDVTSNFIETKTSLCTELFFLR